MRYSRHGELAHLQRGPDSDSNGRVCDASSEEKIVTTIEWSPENVECSLDCACGSSHSLRRLSSRRVSEIPQSKTKTVSPLRFLGVRRRTVFAMMQDSTPVALLKIVAMICWAIPAAMGLAWAAHREGESRPCNFYVLAQIEPKVP